jgi:NAD(P)H-flavin reductase
MYRILSKKMLGLNIHEYVIEAPDIARAARAGQFVVLRLHEHGERIPLTIVESVPELKAIKLVVQELGKTTREMHEKFHEGGSILDLVGPLGEPSEIEKFGTVVCVGGGVGIAPLFPIVRDLKAAGNHVIGILGARSGDHLIYEEKMSEVCDVLYVMTDDGSRGERGFTSNKLGEILDSGEKIDRVWAIGPPIMMKVCAEVTRPASVSTIVSLNPIMVDGTGMCGGCRVEIGGATRFACVHGPEFDGHLVDFDQMMARLRYYSEAEADALERYVEHTCARKQEARQ